MEFRSRFYSPVIDASLKSCRTESIGIYSVYLLIGFEVLVCLKDFFILPFEIPNSVF